MNPQPGQLVNIFFRNGAQSEGIVQSWSDHKSILKSLDNKSLLIIQNTLEDIMAIKIILEQPRINPPKTQLQQQFQETYDKPTSNNLRLKKLAELKVMLNEEEKQEIARKLKTHQISDVKKANYELPGFFKVPSSK